MGPLWLAPTVLARLAGAISKKRGFGCGCTTRKPPSPSKNINCTTAFPERLRSRCRRRDQAELLQHHQLVKHQMERDMLATTKPEHLDVVHLDSAAGRCNVPHGTVENAVLRSNECAFLNYDVIDDVNGLNLDTRVWEGSEPTSEECGASRFSFALHAAWRLENNVVGKNFRKPVKIMSVEGRCPLFEGLARGHC